MTITIRPYEPKDAHPTLTVFQHAMKRPRFDAASF